jgi:hypothetical protein
MDRNELVNAWLIAERLAVETETELKRVGQAAPDPGVAELARRAVELRKEADRLFRLVPKHR